MIYLGRLQVNTKENNKSQKMQAVTIEYITKDTAKKL